MMIATAAAATSMTTPTTPAVRASCCFQNFTNPSQVQESAMATEPWSASSEQWPAAAEAMGALGETGEALAGALDAKPSTNIIHKTLCNRGIGPIPWMARRAPAGARANIAFFGG